MELILYYQHNSKVKRLSGLLSTPSIVNFAGVSINSSKSKGIELSNIGQQIIIISDIVLPMQSQIFNIIPSSLSVSMIPNDKVNLAVDFKPLALQNYSDSLIVHYTVDGCPDSIIIYLNGIGMPAKTVHIRLPMIQNSDPAADELRIPIYANIDNPEPNDQLNGVNLLIDVELNKLLYYPKSAMPAPAVMSQTIDPISDNRIITINVNSANIYAQETVIADIIGSPLLGNTDYTILHIRNATSDNNTDISDFRTEDGSINYKICTEGSNRLITYREPLLMKISPNPANSEITIDINTLEKGIHQLKLIALDGKENIIFNKYFDGKNDIKSSLNMNISELSNGIYLLVFTGPNRSISQKLLILK